jgi:hypothetical protein
MSANDPKLTSGLMLEPGYVLFLTRRPDRGRVSKLRVDR